MTSVQGQRRSCQERPSVTLSVALSIAPPNSFLPPELGDKLSNQLARPLEAKSLVVANNVLKYSEDDLQRILKAVLEAQAPISAPVPAPVASKMSREKLKAYCPDVSYGKSHIDCYNFCQQCEDYFATKGAMGPTWILFAMSFFWDQISFRWQQYKRKHDANTFVPVT